MKRAFRISMACIITAALLLCNPLSAVAEVTLPDGTVAGLPEELTVMDDEGNSVPESGEYYFCVDDMQPNTDYTKNIEILNLREDKAYNIYFYAEPVSKTGEIDLEENTTATITLNGETVFVGSVSGISSDGETDLSKEPINLGYYEPNDSGTLTFTVNWDGTGLDGVADNGSKKITADGVEIISEGNGTVSVYGQVEFRWIFYAEVDESYTPPNTGFFGSTLMYVVVIVILAILIAFMLIAIWIKKRKNKRSEV